MPTIWFAKDGPRPHSQSGPGIRASIQEVEKIAAERQLVYRSEAPSINPEKPSHSEKNVVVEIAEGEESPPSFPKVGFYFVAGVSPEEVENALEAMRG